MDLESKLKALFVYHGHLTFCPKREYKVAHSKDSRDLQVTRVDVDVFLILYYRKKQIIPNL